VVRIQSAPSPPQVLREYGQGRGLEVFCLFITAGEEALRARLSGRGRETDEEVPSKDVRRPSHRGSPAQGTSNGDVGRPSHAAHPSTRSLHWRILLTVPLIQRRRAARAGGGSDRSRMRDAAAR